ncbi:MAG TPA: hypothetical protein VFM68_02095 [Candidatus Saccharimonadales bacterium]|nr:hypothetical protein [Candidatus Saccharimonadales bacterium]
MEPKLPEANIGPEQSAANYSQSLERAPQSSTPEAAIETNAERFEQRSEAAPAAAAATPALPPPYAPAVPPPVVVPSNTVPTVADDTPIVASDDDVIEKEWVDKAKKIIIQTKDNPYLREQEVSKLQADYLRKRYGKELGASQ